MKVGIDFRPYSRLSYFEEEYGYIPLGEIESILQDALNRIFDILSLTHNKIHIDIHKIYWEDIVLELEKYITEIRFTAQRVLKDSLR